MCLAGIPQAFRTCCLSLLFLPVLRHTRASLVGHQSLCNKQPQNLVAENHHHSAFLTIWWIGG